MAIQQPVKLFNSGAWRNCSIKTFSGGAWREIKYAWIFSGGAWRKFYDYTTNAVLYGTSNYRFSPTGGVSKQTGLYAGYGVPGDWSEAADGVIITNHGYDDNSDKWTGKKLTIPAGCTSIRIKCTCDNGGDIYLNQTLLGDVPHMSWRYYDRTVVPGDDIYISLINYGGSKWNGQVVRVDNLTSGGTILKTDLTWVGANA